MFGLSQKPENEISVVFDIGNGSIGAALVRLSEKATPTILYSYREEVAFHDTMDSDKLLFLMDRHLSSVAAHIAKEGLHAVRTMHGPHKLHTAFCIFASPWYISQTKVIQVEKPKPFSVTPKYIEEVIRTEEQRFEKESAEGKFGQLFHDGVVAIDRNIIQTKLNGYEVHNPYGKSTRSLELSLFTSIVSKGLLKKVEDTISRSLHTRHIIPHSFALASFTVIRDVFTHEGDFMFVDVSSEITELSVTKHGVLLESVTFPSGKHSLIRSLSTNLKASPEVAFSLASLGSNNATDPAITAKTDAAMKPFESEWCSYLHKSVMDLAGQVALPRKVYLTCDDDVASFFSAFIEKEKCLQFPQTESTSEEMFTAIFLNAEVLKGFCSLATNIRSDSFLILETIFLNKIFNL